MERTNVTIQSDGAAVSADTWESELGFAGEEFAEPMRNYKDTVFRLLFSDKKALLGLYNALNGTDYPDPDELEINTLEQAIYLGRKNDISFIIHSQLYLYEQQSTLNLNMPLRNLFYVAALYTRITRKENLHGTRRIMIPRPHFVVFYNGTKEQPERKIMRLSEAYQEVVRGERAGGNIRDNAGDSTGDNIRDNAGDNARDNTGDSTGDNAGDNARDNAGTAKSKPQIFEGLGAEGFPDLELKTLMININRGFNDELKKNCRDLYGYMVYVDRVRRNAEKLPIAQAVRKAINDCIRDGILADFLSERQAEVMSMSIFEYDQEKHFRQIEEDYREQGLREGRAEGREAGLREGREAGLVAGRAEGRAEMVLGLLADLGDVPESVSARILAEKKPEVLKAWAKLAVQAESLEWFERQM